jgi:hypothetical protein
VFLAPDDEHLYPGDVALSIASRNAVRHWGAGTAAIARALIAADSPLTGVALARAGGVSQPRASQVLRQFTDHRAVQATPYGYVGDVATLLDLYARRSKPLLVDPESYWYSRRPMTDQADGVLRLARESDAQVAFSADLGPDLLAPWRHPTLTVVYAGPVLDALGDGFVPAEGRADASIILRRTADPTLLAPAPPWPKVVEDVPLTDPTQQLCDLLDLGGEDRREAADRLRDAIVRRTLLTGS